MTLNTFNGTFPTTPHSATRCRSYLEERIIGPHQARVTAPFIEGNPLSPDYALSAHLFAYEPLRFEHLKEAAEAGFRKIELWAMTPNFDVSDESRLKSLQGRLADLALTTSTFHAPFYADLSEARAGRWLSLAATDKDAREAAIEKTIQALRAFRPLGARVAILHPSAPGKAGDMDTCEALEESISRLLPLAEETDTVLALENIPSALGRAEPLAGFVGRIDHPRLKICIDTGHALITEGENTKSAIERLASFCAATHLHDNDGRNDAHLIPGEGAFEWPSFFTTLDAQSYSETLALELRRKEEPYAKTLADAARAIHSLASQIKPNPA